MRHVESRALAFVLFFLLLITLVSCGSKTKEDVEVDELSAAFTVAYAKELDADVKEKIKALEKDKGITVGILDYSEYNTQFDRKAGEEKLALDLATGLIKPDLIIAAKSTNTVAQTMMEKGLWLDLTPYLETDGQVNLDNVFGSVLESFTTSDGKIWGLSNIMAAQTLLGNNALLGEFAGNDGWTVGEMLDFAEDLPEDVILMDVSRESAQNVLLGEDGYLSFVDLQAGTCSFDSPEFLRWLNFVDSIPTGAELSVSSPLMQVEEAERYSFYHNDRIALKEQTYFNLQQMVRDPAVFGKKDYTRIGYAGGVGSVFTAFFDTTFIISKDAARPDLAWELIAACFAPDRFEDGKLTGGGTIPVLKNVYDELCEQYYNMIIISRFSGGGGMMEKDPETEVSEELLDEPGYIFEFTEEDAVRLKQDLDSHNVTRIAERLPSAAKAIVDEEISAYLAGRSTAEICAAAIQSRVSIWLAEHK